MGDSPKPKPRRKKKAAKRKPARPKRKAKAKPARKKKAAAKPAAKKKPAPKPKPAALIPGRLVSMNAYATMRGVSWQAVKKAHESGRLQQSCRRVGKGWRIDPFLADQEWDQNTQAVQQREQPTAEVEVVDTLFGPEAVAPAAPAPNPDAVKMKLAQASRATWQARREELNYRKAAGELIDANEARIRVFTTGVAIREALFAIPDSVSSALAAETSSRKIHQTLISEITTALETLQALEAKLRSQDDDPTREV